jgi:hypothetical protein
MPSTARYACSFTRRGDRGGPCTTSRCSRSTRSDILPSNSASRTCRRSRIVGVEPTSAQRRLCRPRDCADVGCEAAVQQRESASSGRHNLDRRQRDAWVGSTLASGLGGCARTRHGTHARLEFDCVRNEQDPGALCRDCRPRCRRWRVHLRTQRRRPQPEEPDCADLVAADPVTPQAIQPQGRHNREVGTIGVIRVILSSAVS